MLTGFDDKKDAYNVTAQPTADDVSSGTILNASSGLKRGLKTRHITLISFSSVVGAGTFYGFGYALQLSGPLGALIGFAITGFIVWALMQSVGEVTTMFPIQGGFIEHAGRFVDPAFSFSISWLYYLMWSAFLGSEWNGCIMILQYWVPEETMPLYAWTLIFLVIFCCMTTVGVSIYGELEFWLGWFKLISLGVCMFISLLVNVGAFGNGYIGFRYWKAPTVINGIQGFGIVFVMASEYYVGTEILSLAAGETKNPIKAIPKGVNTIIYRVLFVYMGTMFFQGIICPSDADDLLNAHSKVASSPFTIGFTQAGWASAGHFMNTIIVIAFISAANGCIFVQARAMYGMAISGRAPRIFAKTSKKGVPYVAILSSCSWGLLALMNMKITAGKLFGYFVSVCGTAAYITWGGIIFTHLRMRAGLEKQGIDPATWPFRAFGSIWIYRFNLFLCIFILFINGFTSIEPPFHWKDFIAAYITIPTSIALFVGWKLYHKTRWVNLEDMDFSDRLVKIENHEPKKPSMVRRIIQLLRKT